MNSGCVLALAAGDSGGRGVGFFGGESVPNVDCFGAAKGINPSSVLLKISEFLGESKLLEVECGKGGSFMNEKCGTLLLSCA